MSNYRPRRNPNGRFRKLMGDRYIEDIDRREVYETYNGICAICEEPLKFRDMTLDHITPLHLGGEHSYANIQPAHGLCNHLKDNIPMEDVDVEAIKAERTRRRMKKRKDPYYNHTGAVRA